MRLVFVLASSFVFVGCSHSSFKHMTGTVNQSGLSRFVDKDNGTICYVYEKKDNPAISCLDVGEWSMTQIKSALDYIPIHYHTAFKILSCELGDFANFNLMANEIAEEFLMCVENKMTMKEIQQHFKDLSRKDI